MGSRCVEPDPEELLPGAYEEGSRARVGLLTSLALVAMILFQAYLG